MGEICQRDKMIKGNNISVSLNSRQILNNVSIEINPAEITVVIGPSGSGKTTLLRTLAFLNNPSSGEIIIDDLKFVFPIEKRRLTHQTKVGLVFQNLFLWPHLTNRQNILLALGKYLSEAQNSKLKELIEVFDLSEFIDRYPNESSLGQKQRIALARALILEPRYLMLDEVTSSLDIEQIGTVLTYLKKLKDEGIGILIITHFLVFAEKAADKVFFLEDGQIVESGSSDILMSPKTQRFSNFMNSLGDILVNKKVDLEFLLSNKWTNSDLSDKIRWIHRILDHETLSIQRHKEIFYFVIDNWALFKDYMLNWLGVTNPVDAWEVILKYIIESLIVKDFPETKKWIYLLSLKLYPDYLSKHEAIEILTQYLNHPFEINQMVAHKLLKIHYYELPSE